MPAKKGVKGVERPRIDEVKFVKVWMATAKRGGHIGEVADEIGCTLGGASTKFKSLVERGVKIQKLPRKPRKSAVSVDELNAIVKAGK